MLGDWEGMSTTNIGDCGEAAASLAGAPVGSLRRDPGYPESGLPQHTHLAGSSRTGHSYLGHQSWHRPDHSSPARWLRTHQVPTPTASVSEKIQLAPGLQQTQGGPPTPHPATSQEGSTFTEGTPAEEAPAAPKAYTIKAKPQGWLIYMAGCEGHPWP